jgi:fucose 4-O-acetylase-like acetyltransferase
MQKRIGYIDIARGIGILLVVLGHNDLKDYHPILNRMIYSFHVPLFFFLSGMFFRPDRSFGGTLRRKFDTILKPFLFTIFIIYLGKAAFSESTFLDLAARLPKDLYGSGKYLEWVQLWFLPALFLVSLLAWVLWRFALGRVKWDWLRWILLAGLLALGVWLVPMFWPYTIPFVHKEFLGLPFSADLVPVCAFYFLLGYEINQKPLEKYFASPIFFIVTFAAFLTLNLTLHVPLELNLRRYPSLLWTTLIALLGIAATLSLSRMIEAWSPRLTSLFSYLGRISLVILIFHKTIQETLFGKFMRLHIPQDISIALAFLSGVLVSVLIYELIVRPNRTLRPWFGFAAEESTSEAMK